MSLSRYSLLFVVALSAPAQMLVNPASLPARLRSFEKAAPEEQISCKVHPVRPALNLGFRFQTGYTAEVPMKQFGGEGRSLSIVLRVTPEAAAAEPTWFATRLRVPPSQDKRAYAEVSGGYIVGEGAYHVDMVLADDRQKVCTASWNIRAKMSDKVRDVRPGLPPGAVDDFALRRSRRPASDEPDRYTVSILLHAASTAPNRVLLRDYDRTVLLSALGSMADRLPARIRLTVFSLDNQKELFHTDELTADSFGQAVEALNGVELGKVDYSVLQKPSGHLDLLSRLLERETGGAKKPDAVIFISPVGHSEQRLAAEALPETTVPMYNVQLRPWRMRVPIGPDTVSKAVQQLGGKTRMIYTPEDFAGAIQDIEKLLGVKQAASPQPARVKRD